ncbi:MAG: Uncharacterised protein [Synechococcus sp. CC9902]|nr:MAG: Uncharacterised protein [Synechococcus sp. CC9902]
METPRFSRACERKPLRERTEHQLGCINTGRSIGWFQRNSRQLLHQLTAPLPQGTKASAVLHRLEAQLQITADFGDWQRIPLAQNCSQITPKASPAVPFGLQHQ